MKPIEPQQRDGIPREVASAMLSEPRARLTARMRKNCMAAREKVFVSSSPIVGRVVFDEQNIDQQKWGLFHTECESKPLEDRLRRRLARASLRQLGNWLRRSISRRVIVQRKYLAVPNSDVPAFQARFDAVRAALSELASRLDSVRDLCEDEVTMRYNTCDSVVAIRRAGKTSVDFSPRA